MAITSIGYEGTVDYADWASLISHAGAEYSVFGQDDFKVAVGAGTREVTVQPGRAFGKGILDDSDDIVTLTGASVGAGDRWDLVVLRRDWVETSGGGAETTLVLIQGTAAKAIPARSTTPGAVDDQPIALVRFSAGQTAAQEIVDLRCFAGSGGGLVARDPLALNYFTRIGTRVRILGSTYILGWDSTTPGWRSDAPYVGTTEPPYFEGQVWVKVP